jgi:hypothetical protein
MIRVQTKIAVCCPSGERALLEWDEEDPGNYRGKLFQHLMKVRADFRKEGIMYDIV